MIPIFLGLCLAAFGCAYYTYFHAFPWSSGESNLARVEKHQLLGLYSAVLFLVAQCSVFVYFLGTGKAIKTAVEKRGLDPDFAARTRKLKGRAFPFATFAALAVVAGAVYGGTDRHETHGIVILSAIGLNLLAMPFEIRAMMLNSRLMDETSDDLERAEEKIVQSGGSLADEDAAPPAFLLGRTLVVIAGSAWLVFAYRVLIMKSGTDSWPWYAIVSAAGIALGSPMLWLGRKKTSAS